MLLSGGLDSAVTAAIAASEGFEVHALTVRYGQRHSAELNAAARVARAVGAASHRHVDVDLRAIGGSALTDDIDVPKADPRSTIHDPRPPTYVPARNTVLLGLALAHAEAIGARDIFIGVSSVDYSGYPDCRPRFVRAFERLAGTATRAGADDGVRFRIHAPLQRMSKARTILRGIELGLDLSLTHSCYDPAPHGLACGLCDSCRLRRKGFEEAGVEDPTAYAAVSGRPRPRPRPREGVRVVEAYPALLGESSAAGTPCAIVRLAGCPLECRWCDTAYARDAASGTEMTVEEVVATVLGFGLRSVLVTGGEPLAQEGAGRLLSALADAGMDVMLETSGALDIRTVDPRVRRIVDIKCPSSGMMDRNLDSNVRELRPTDEIKFAIADRADYEWAREVVRREALDRRCTVLFSPVAGRMDAAALAERIIADRLPVRLQIQLHRVLWPDRDRGV